MTTQVAAPDVGLGRMLGVERSTSISKFQDFRYTSAVASMKVFIAPIRLILTGIAGVTAVAGSGGACTFPGHP